MRRAATRIPAACTCMLLIAAEPGIPAASAGTPLAPWTTPIVHGHVVELAGKSIELTAADLPGQISVNGRALLARAPAFQLDGKDLVAAPGQAPLTRRLDAGSEAARYDADLVDGDEDSRMRLRLHASIEFDGLIRLAFTTAGPATGLAGRKFTYRIPFADGVARFAHRWGPVGSRNVDLDAAGPGALSGPYLPFLWLGDDEHGLFWLCETTAGWAQASRPDTIRIVTEGRHRVLEISVVIAPSADGHWRHEFALMPTPVKPLPDGWRGTRLLPAREARGQVIWPDEAGFRPRHFGYPDSSAPAAFRAYVDDLRRAGRIALPYVTPTWISTGTREWQRHAAQWQGGVADTAIASLEAGEQFVNTCQASRSWQQFVAKEFPRFIAAYGLDGLYMDNAQAYPIHGCLDRAGPADAIDYPLMDQRRGYLAIMKALRSHSRRTLGVVHASGGLNLPSFDFADAWVSGEQYRGVVDDDYLKVATLADFRVELNGPHWGIVPVFLPEFSAARAQQVAPTRKLMAILLLHDAIPWPAWANLQEIDRGLSMLDAFGIGDARFVPYYSDHPLARISGSPLYVSGYVGAGRSLLIVANLSDQPARSTVCTDAATADHDASISTWPERLGVPTDSGCFEVQVDPGSYRMYVAARGTG